VIIAGGGKFGKIAIDFVKKKRYIALLIDSDPNCYASKYSNINIRNLDEFLTQNNNFRAGDIIFLNHDVSVIYALLKKIIPKFLIPVVPIHLMGLILTSYLADNAIMVKPNIQGTEIFIDQVNPELLLNHKTEEGVAYLSHAKIDEVCPENCIGPENFCPIFKREKPITITRYLKNFYKVDDIAKIELDNENKIIKAIIIVESIQLMPGLGGIEGNHIKKIFKTLQNNLDLFLNKNYELLVATTCNCHGVMNFYKNSKK
jgi:hypothetical protein